MDFKNITKIIDLMTRKNLASFEIEDAGLKLKIVRSAPAEVLYGGPQGAPMSVAVPLSGPSATPVVVAPAEPSVYLKSPTVGTFYSAISAQSEPYVKVGSRVSSKSVVCILEAMKVMNEIPAEMDAEILEIMVQNGAPVEYGQPLFRVKKH